MKLCRECEIFTNCGFLNKKLAVCQECRKTKEKIEIIKKFQIGAWDTGSIYVQIGLLTARIYQILEHLATQKKDFSARDGLYKQIGRRRRLINYLEKFELKKIHYYCDRSTGFYRRHLAKYHKKEE